MEKLRGRQRNVLVTVLAINAVFFLIEATAGLVASSTALLADSLDMLGDALVYAFSLFVVSRNDLWKARSATLKGWIMLGFGLFVLAQAGYKLAYPEVPRYRVIELVALAALAANAFCLALLWRHRGDDVNMRSVWLCSRNDIIANVSVLVAGVGVGLFASQWPDILVGFGIATLFLRSAIGVLREAAATRAHWRSNAAGTAARHPGQVS
jgi:Co/Zn/Cd efflux system component